MDDLIDADFGKHDYDWLLTPPETPLLPSSHVIDHEVPSTVSRGRSIVRSVSTARASRVSASQLQNGHSMKPARSSSLTRPSILNAYGSSSVNGNNSRTSMLNTSIASVTSKPLTQGNRLTTTRPSLTSRPLPARSQAPAKSRPAPTSPGAKTTKSHNSRPSTPTSRSQIRTNSNPNVTSSPPHLHSRTLTPTRKPTNSLLAPATGRATSVGRVRNPAASAIRPSSPSPHTRAPDQPIDIPNFPSDAPPNLRTRLPERPASAGRVRPGAALTTRTNLNSQNVASTGSNRSHSLPVASHSKFPENSAKDELRSNKHHAASSEMQRSAVSDSGVKKTNKVGGITDSGGFGRNISKKSLDMALRHMNIKQSIGGIRGIRGTALFPHSSHSNAPKTRPARMSEPAIPVAKDEVLAVNGNCNGIASPDCERSVSDNGVPAVPVAKDEVLAVNGNCNGIASPDCERSVSDNGDLAANKIPQLKPLIMRERDPDLYGSSRYDALLLTEDSKNMNWLHSIEDNSDQSPGFDHRSEPLPEPFGLL